MYYLATQISDKPLLNISLKIKPTVTVFKTAGKKKLVFKKQRFLLLNLNIEATKNPILIFQTIKRCKSKTCCKSIV